MAREVGVEGRLGGQAHVPGTAGTWKDLTGNVNMLAANLTGQVRAIAEVATAVTKGDLTRSVQVEARGEMAELKDNINTMIDNLRLTTERNTEQDWLKTNLARFTSMLQGQRDLVKVGQRLLSELAPLVGANQGVIYQRSEDPERGPCLRLLASYADDGQGGPQPLLRLGEGLVGQCAVERRRMLIGQLPPDSIRIGSGLFSASPKNVIVLPVVFEDQLMAVIELASLGEYTTSHLAFLEQLTSSIGIVLNSIEATMQTENLLAQSQSKNQQIEQARRALEEKAEELALTSRFKSEFLANMSHELRTPLNSILILGQQLSDNPEANLTPKQVEFARTIHSAGSDLLNLITDILDLSKIESGTVTVEPAEVYFSTLLDSVSRPFRHDADARGLTFDVQLDVRLGRSLFTDSKRLQQVLKNLLSNAFKFTESGGVRLDVAVATEGWSVEHALLANAGAVIAFSVSDTGIGIAPEKQKIIFEAFQQADAGTSRKYGGTGLGLAISRELATLLGGEIHLRSQPGSGSSFTLYLPLRYQGPSTAVPTVPRRQFEPAMLMATHAADASPDHIPDDRATLTPEDSTLLIVEDDPHYARVLADLAREHGFKVLVAHRGTDALELAREFRPTAVSLDVFLPDMLGWTVLSHLKQTPELRHIPVQIVTLDENRQHGLSRGAFSFVTKPATTEGLDAAFSRIKNYANGRRKRLLIVEDNQLELRSVQELLGHDDIDVVTASTGAEALAVLKEQVIDCMVLDLRLPDMSGVDVLAQVQGELKLPDLPVVVFTGKDLSPEQEAQLQELARTVVIKGVESPERLLDETSLFLHRVITDLPPHKREMLERLHRSDEDLKGRQVLIVDDDVRNIFALGSVLERRGMQIITAQTGREALATLERTPDIAIVLLDIMMPEMDGYQTMALIRRQEPFRRLPIIALTAKAMKGDREKCLEAGASDYLAKPVNTDQLLATLRSWLHR